MSEKKIIWSDAILLKTASIKQAVQNLTDTSFKIVIVTNEVGEFEGTVSDGDIRRGLLRGLDFDSSIKSIVQKNAFVVTSDLKRELILQLMTANKIQQIPIVDVKNKISGLHLWDEIARPIEHPNLVVIMAGGQGLRMRPHTNTCPKPMLKINGRPMIEHIIERAKNEGFRNFLVSINYLGHMIEDYLGKGEKLDVNIQYLREDLALGTAGALSLIKSKPDNPLIVTNGDIISDVRYSELLDFHRKQNSVATMAVRQYEWQNPFGVVSTDGTKITGFQEKPLMRSQINAGVYALEPVALDFLSSNAYCDMPSLFEKLQAKGSLTVAYPMHEPWIDVGRPDDLRIINNK